MKNKGVHEYFDNLTTSVGNYLVIISLFLCTFALPSLRNLLIGFQAHQISSDLIAPKKAAVLIRDDNGRWMRNEKENEIKTPLKEIVIQKHLEELASILLLNIRFGGQQRDSRKLNITSQH